MKKLLDLITEELKKAFEKAGYDSSKIKASVSNRPDLCEYQCNGAMALAKAAHKAPMEIAEGCAGFLKESPMFSRVEVCRPGFINMDLKGEFVASYVQSMAQEEKFGLEEINKGKTVLIDYGGPNVAKPLHIGHLRSAIIGESIKRILRYTGASALGDIHMGDWGLQMGQIIAELKERQPDLPYFDEDYEGEYPKEAPFTIGELEEIYPAASKKCKVNEEFYEEAKKATAQLQAGRRGYKALWNHIMDISKADLKKNYDNLNVSFELWNGESSVQGLIPEMVEKMKADGFAKESEGALVVDVSEETDKKEVPPCIILKSDGATLYATTDLATLVQRERDYDPDHIIYVVDKRQDLHFKQVFRTAKKTGIVKPETELSFLGFGTMNGKDGQPYKTREGGVMRLETLISEINEAAMEKMKEGREVDENDPEAIETAKKIGLSALKYGDLSNQATKDYIFDLNKFISFEGNTGPYILYTIVRIKSILSKYGKKPGKKISYTGEPSQKALMLALADFNEAAEAAAEELSPNRICAYIYALSNAFNSFYHEVRILSCGNEAQKESYINLLFLTQKVLETCIDLLGFSAPEKM